MEQLNIASQCKEILYLPNGDGVCICLIGIEQFSDVHLQLAEKILEIVRFQEKFMKDFFAEPQGHKQKTFEIRIAVNNDKIRESDDIVEDIARRTNIVGNNINTCARIMDFAGTNQLTIAANCVDWITSVAYDKNEKEFNTRYVGRFIKYIARDKHGREHIFFTKGTMLPPAIIPSLRHIDNSFQYAAYVLDSNIGADLSEIQGFLDLWNFLDAQHIERDLPLSGLRAIMSLIRSLPNKTDRS